MNKQSIRSIFLLAIILSLSPTICGDQGRSNDQAQDSQKIIDLPLNGKRYRPKITLQEALKLAEKYIKKNKIEINSFYLIEARMIQYGGEKETKEPRWFFIWLNETSSMGINIEITVNMDGKVDRHPSM